MARRACLLLVSLLTLSACSKASHDAPQADVAAEAVPDRSAGEVSSARQAAKPDAPLVTAPSLAYAYDYEISAPAKGLRSLQAEHEAACEAAGPTVCQVLGANVSENGADEVRATLSIRATSAWLTKFRAGLGAQAKDAGGRISRAQTNTVDLSRALVDTEAAIRAKSTLRDRLQQLLASRPGKLAETLELEQELARVQGEIDAMQSELAVMRTRVAMSKLDIAYVSTGVLAPEGVSAPIGSAVSDIAGVFAVTAAFMIRLLTWVGPWALLAGGGWWLWGKRRRKPRKARPEQALAADVEGQTPV